MNLLDIHLLHSTVDWSVCVVGGKTFPLDRGRPSWNAYVPVVIYIYENRFGELDGRRMGTISHLVLTDVASLC